MAAPELAVSHAFSIQEFLPKAPPETPSSFLDDWINRNMRSLEALAAERLPYRIDDTKPHSLEFAEGEMSYNCETVDKGSWKVTFQKNGGIPAFSPVAASDVEAVHEGLSIRQDLFLPKSDGMREHQRGIYFFGQNWERIRNIIGSSNFDQASEVAMPAYWYNEVKLDGIQNPYLKREDHYGQADFVGFMHDHIGIFEFGKTGKIRQPRVYEDGVSRLFPSLQHTLHSYAVRYDFSQDVHTLVVTPFPEFAKYDPVHKRLIVEEPKFHRIMSDCRVRLQDVPRPNVSYLQSLRNLRDSLKKSRRG